MFFFFLLGGQVNVTVAMLFAWEKDSYLALHSLSSERLSDKEITRKDLETSVGSALEEKRKIY